MGGEIGNYFFSCRAFLFFICDFPSSFGLMLGCSKKKISFINMRQLYKMHSQFFVQINLFSFNFRSHHVKNRQSKTIGVNMEALN